MAASCSSAVLWLAIKVVSGAKVLFGSKIVSCSVEESFGELLSRLEGERFAERQVHKVNLDEGSGKCHHEVQLEAPLRLCTQENFHCNAVVFYLVEQENPGPDSSRPNAFDVLMNSQRRILLPQKSMGEKLRADQRMRNDVIDLFASWNVGWSPDTVQTLGERCIKVIVSALWYLDPHHDRFRSRSLIIPPCFMRFTGYNDWKRKKEKQPRIQQGDIDRHIQALSALLCQPWCHKPSFKMLQSQLVALVEVMKHYCEYLKKHGDSMQAAHSSTTVLRNVEDNILLETRAPVPQCDAEYCQIQEKLSSLPLYQPVFVNDYSPLDRYVRRHWLDKLQLEFPVKMYRYSRGNNL